MLVDAVRQSCLRFSSHTFFVAYSGGLDSHVLLHVLSVLQRENNFNVCAVHINHQIHADANAWMLHCKKVCADLNVSFQHFQINMNTNTGDSIEACARRERYAVLANLLKANDVLLTAHHQDDQAETLLVQMLRGAGPKGLAAMPMQKTLGKGLHLRPFLSFTRTQLTAYAKEHDLQWIEDSSNQNHNFTRNYIR